MVKFHIRHNKKSKIQFKCLFNIIGDNNNDYNTNIANKYIDNMENFLCSVFRHEVVVVVGGSAALPCHMAAAKDQTNTRTT